MHGKEAARRRHFTTGLRLAIIKKRTLQHQEDEKPTPTRTKRFHKQYHLVEHGEEAKVLVNGRHLLVRHSHESVHLALLKGARLADNGADRDAAKSRGKAAGMRE